MTLGEKINAANAEALKIILGAQPTLIGVGTAGEDIPGMTKKTILHSGPPVTWENMCDPTKGAVIGALIYEGLANTPEEAEKLAASGEITFTPDKIAGSLTTKVINVEGSNLPSTGGMGTVMLYVAGIAVFVLAGATLVMALRRRNA